MHTMVIEAKLEYTWYNLSNRASVQMTQYHIYAGDNAYLRLVP